MRVKKNSFNTFSVTRNPSVCLYIAYNNRIIILRNTEKCQNRKNTFSQIYNEIICNAFNIFIVLRCPSIITPH